MKKHINRIVLYLFVLTLGLSGCKDSLDVDRVGTITPEEMWDNADFVRFYVNGFYNGLPNWNQDAYFTEEASSASLSRFLRGINASSDDFPDREWPYDKIRSINVFLENIDQSTAKLTDTDKQHLKGQALFFRAFNYYKMVKVMGGVPLITKVLEPTSELDALSFPRNSTIECFDFIITELDAAIALLPPKGTANYESNRITKAAAMALKGEVLLWKASPLFCKTKNPTYWKEAYTALNEAKVELDLEGYGLYDDGTVKTSENFWYDKEGAKKEQIIFLEFKYPLKQNGHQQAQRPLSTSSGGSGGNEPTWELVQAYPMADGKDINDPTSNYNPKKFWMNRDPRFYNTIVYNGATYGIGNDAKRRQWIFSGLDLDGFGKGNNSGFYSRKGIDTTLTIDVWSHQAFDWPILRYAEVLLNIAECANELDDHKKEARDIIKTIRKRAHLLPGNDGEYGLKATVGTDYQATLDAIMKERLIEFAYEGKRFNDLRRRRMYHVLNDMNVFHSYAPYVNSENATALNIGLTPTSSVAEVIEALNRYLNDPTLNLDENEVIEKVTDFKVDRMDANLDAFINIPERNYFAPLHQDWLKKNPKLKQNSGWDNGDFNPVIQ